MDKNEALTFLATPRAGRGRPDVAWTERKNQALKVLAALGIVLPSEGTRLAAQEILTPGVKVSAAKPSKVATVATLAPLELAANMCEGLADLGEAMAKAMADQDFQAEKAKAFAALPPPAATTQVVATLPVTSSDW